MDKKYNALFESYKINNLELKNRFFMAPMGIPISDENGAYTNDAIEYYVARAKGGVGLIITGANSVGSNGAKNKKCFWPTPLAHPEAYKNAGIELTERIHAYGCKIFIQLTAAPASLGRLEQTDFGTPGATINSKYLGIASQDLTPTEIAQIVTGFAESARIVQASGFDGVEVHTGYLLDIFTDQYGRDIDGRLQIVTEIIQSIKKACGKDFPVILRFSMKSYRKALEQVALPQEEFVEVGWDIGEALEAAKILEAAGCDGFDVNAGKGDSSYWAYPPTYFEKGLLLPLSEQLKKIVNVPVMVAGRMDDPDLVAVAFAEGKLDAVGLARPLLADPDYSDKVKNHQLMDIRPCLGCNDGCVGRILTGSRGSCTVNPECNREMLVRIESAETAKKVMIVGGGPAGMEAARVSALRGHQVTLFESSYGLGGKLKYSSQRILKTDDHRLIKWYEQQLNRLKVEIRLDEAATNEKIAAFNPDVVFIAQGSKARQLEFPGMDSEKVTNAIDVISDKKYVGPRCTVIGGGLAGCEVALHLAKHRHKMTIIEQGSDILAAGIPLAPANKQMLHDLLDFYHVEIITNARLKAVTETGAVIEVQGQERSMPAHHVIIAVGFESATALHKQIKNDYPEVYNIGDSQKIRNIRGAIWDAYEVAHLI
ncbi:MAG: FAD-dependent oxidoreductase [Firmicutes bacterium]|nr:FAD-dependent oxidoreductase [Bacillota bacterium]